MNPLNALKKFFPAKSLVAQSRLEYLFATAEGAKHLDEVIARSKNEEMKDSFATACCVLIFAGARAKALQKAMLDVLENLKEQGAAISQSANEVQCSFDEMFAEVSAIYFYRVQEYWDEEFSCADDDDVESEDKYSLHSLRYSTRVADRFIKEWSAANISENILGKRVMAYYLASERGEDIFKTFCRNVISHLVPDTDMASLLSGSCLALPCLSAYSKDLPTELRAAIRSVYHLHCGDGDGPTKA